MKIGSRSTRTLLTIGALALSASALVAIRVEIDDSVPAANPRSGSPANVVIDDYKLVRIAQGSDPLENPSGPITTFGYLNDLKKTKTEADENTYLEFDHNPGGPTSGYDYGRRFLYQGHENSGGLAYVTRINLDIQDPAHRITLLTAVDPTTGKTGFSSIDGSTWNPFTKTLLFTQENNSTKGVIEITPGWPPAFRTLEGIVGMGGFEGIHPDDDGNLIIVEDVGGVGVNVVTADPTSPKTAKQPNSFVYKFVPYDRTNLGAGGQMFALRVWVDGSAVTFHAADPVGDTFSDAQKHLHTPGTSWPADWVLVHDTATDTMAPFSANAAAKSRGASPFKRPENAQFLPGSRFNTFFFCATGDTDRFAGEQPELAARGSWGSIFRVDFRDRQPVGTIRIVVLGDADHASFDNLAFVDDDTLLAAEDRGDSLHEQLNVFDSVWAFDVEHQHHVKARRLLALGRDADATATVLAGADGDNEPTGLHASDGDPTIAGLLGRHELSEKRSRWFVTQQHGLNQVFEFVFAERSRGWGKHD